MYLTHILKAIKSREHLTLPKIQYISRNSLMLTINKMGAKLEYLTTKVDGCGENDMPLGQNR